MINRNEILEDLGYGAMYAPPIRKNGEIYKGVLSCDSAAVLKYLHTELWVVLHLDHHARPPPQLGYVDMYQIDPFFASGMGSRLYVHATNRDFIDPTVFKPLGLEKKYDVIFNSAWARLKRHELFIEGLVYAKQQGRPASVLMMGYHADGYTSQEVEGSVRHMIERHGLAVDIMDTEWDSHEVNVRYNLCRCAVHTASGEAGPKVLPEAALADLPYLVTSDTYGGCPGHVSVGNGNGLVFDPRPDAMAEAIWWALDNATKFEPRKWALANMCKPVGEERLRVALSRLAASLGCAINTEGIAGTTDMAYEGVFEAEEAILAA